MELESGESRRKEFPAVYSPMREIGALIGSSRRDVNPAISSHSQSAGLTYFRVGISRPQPAVALGADVHCSVRGPSVIG